MGFFSKLVGKRELKRDEFGRFVGNGTEAERKTKTKIKEISALTEAYKEASNFVNAVRTDAINDMQALSEFYGMNDGSESELSEILKFLKKSGILDIFLSRLSQPNGHNLSQKTQENIEIPQVPISFSTINKIPDSFIKEQLKKSGVKAKDLEKLIKKLEAVKNGFDK